MELSLPIKIAGFFNLKSSVLYVLSDTLFHFNLSSVNEPSSTMYVLLLIPKAHEF